MKTIVSCTLFFCFRFFGHESKSGSCYSILAWREGNLILFNLIFPSISWTSSGFCLSIKKLGSVTFKLDLVASPWLLLVSSRYTSFYFIIRHFQAGWAQLKIYYDLENEFFFSLLGPTSWDSLSTFKFFYIPIHHVIMGRQGEILLFSFSGWNPC